MSEGITPLVWSIIAEYGTTCSSFAVARSHLKQWGIQTSLRRIERLTYYFGLLGSSSARLEDIPARTRKISNRSCVSQSTSGNCCGRWSDADEN